MDGADIRAWWAADVAELNVPCTVDAFENLGCSRQAVAQPARQDQDRAGVVIHDPRLAERCERCERCDRVIERVDGRVQRDQATAVVPTSPATPKP